MDTAGVEEYDLLRPLSYDNTDIFLVTFIVVERDSLLNVKFKWHKEVKHYQKNAKVRSSFKKKTDRYFRIYLLEDFSILYSKSRIILKRFF